MSNRARPVKKKKAAATAIGKTGKSPERDWLSVSDQPRYLQAAQGSRGLLPQHNYNPLTTH